MAQTPIASRSAAIALPPSGGVKVGMSVGFGVSGVGEGVVVGDKLGDFDMLGIAVAVGRWLGVHDGLSVGGGVPVVGAREGLTVGNKSMYPGFCFAARPPWEKRRRSRATLRPPYWLAVRIIMIKVGQKTAEVLPV